MAIQDQSVGTRSHSVLPGSDGISLRAGLQSVAGAQLGDQFSCGDDYAPKVRKPYTITKQRERWSEEEHNKFLEALKLYGRAWRRIEDHVGTKTAVQIRSHAQKFFSKVVRDSNGSNTSSEPMEIPPPRPKRKPMHPYPRKLVVPTNKEITAVEQPRRSASPNLSVSERQNQSPTSVLSAIGSDVGGSTDSDTPNGCLSPISSAAVQPGVIPLSELNRSSKRSASPLPALMTVGSVSDVELPVKLELFPKENVYAKEGTSEEASTRCLKLFGRTVLVTQSHRPSSTSVGTGKSMSPNIHDEKVVQALPMNFLPAKSMSGNGECSWSQLQHEALGALYLTPYRKENLNLTEASSAPPTPWWTFNGGLSFPLIPFLKVEKSKAYVDCDLGEVQDKEVQKEGSWTGSTGSVNGGEDCDKYSDGETQSQPLLFKNENQDGGLVFELRPDAKSAFSELRASPEKRVKGFIPYKRCIVERETPSLTITGQEGDEKRVRLCL